MRFNRWKFPAVILALAGVAASVSGQRPPHYYPANKSAMSVNGIGEWRHPLDLTEIDDSGMRRISATGNGVFNALKNVSFAMLAEGKNIVYTSLWHNSALIELDGRAKHVYVALAGSTNHMQHRIENAVLKVSYVDGSVTELPLVASVNYAPIEQDIYTDDHAFALTRGRMRPYRFHLATGMTSLNLGDEPGIDGVYGRRIEGGAGVLADIRTDPEKELKSLNHETLSNDVVIGIMGVSCQRPK